MSKERPYAPPPDPDDIEVSLEDLGESELNFNEDFRNDDEFTDDRDDFEDSDLFDTHEY